MDTWLQAPANCLLSSGEVHVWCAPIDQPLEAVLRLEASLCEDERARALRFQNDQARSQFIVGRGVLRQLLGAYLQEDPSSIVFAYGSRGKPLVQGASKKIGFNLSHSGTLAVLAFSLERELGLDVEQLVELSDMDAIAHHFFAPEEAARVAAEQNRKVDLFYSLWTRKEAVLKCSGRGIDDDCRARGLEFTGTICPFVPQPGYIAALAAEGAPFCLKTYQWTPDRARYGSHQSLLPR